MARVFVTGSSDGLGLMAAHLLLEQGHTVVAHARNDERAASTRRQIPGVEAVLVGDFSSLSQVSTLAEAANASDTFDAVIHNAAVGYKERSRKVTEDGWPAVFQINTLAPYLLTARMHRPKRLVYLSSELHRRGEVSLKDALWEERHWNGNRAYAETKFHDVLLAFAFARHWPEVLSNALEPGWVPTKMGGAHATGDLDQGCRTQVWLATSEDAQATVTGEYFYHLQIRKPARATRDVDLQERLLALCSSCTGASVS